MYKYFDLNKFICEKVLQRSQSLFTEDLLKFDEQLHHQIDDKAILVIGGAGTIGSNYIKSVLKFRPKKLYVVDINENGLTELVRDLRSSDSYHIPDDFITYPINFGDQIFEKIFRTTGCFDIVANFAAHKHVRSEKDVFSIEAMIENNVLRARRLLDLLLDSRPEHFFCVSTDKAANPVNVMGASKKLMEELIMAYSGRLPITTARFANVAFSNGSLPLGFLERLGKRQPWACPVGIKRFFVSPQESGDICLIASVLGKSGDILFPKLNEETDMKDFSQIALALLHELGLKADICKTEEEARQKASSLGNSFSQYPIYLFESDTSGEKSFEEFYTKEEKLDMDTFQNLGIIKDTPKKNIEEINHIFTQLNQLFSSKNIDKTLTINVLKEHLHSFAHIEKGKHLDQKM